MVENNPKTRHQDLELGVSLRHGVSVAGAYLSWTQTEPILDIFVKAVQYRRAYSCDGQHDGGRFGLVALP